MLALRRVGQEDHEGQPSLHSKTSWKKIINLLPWLCHSYFPCQSPHPAGDWHIGWHRYRTLPLLWMVTWGDLSSEPLTVPKDTVLEVESQISEISDPQTHNSESLEFQMLKSYKSETTNKNSLENKTKGRLFRFHSVAATKTNSNDENLSRKQVMERRLARLSCSSLWKGSQGRNLKQLIVSHPQSATGRNYRRDATGCPLPSPLLLSHSWALCLENGADHSGLGLSTSINLTKTIP